MRKLVEQLGAVFAFFFPFLFPVCWVLFNERLDAWARHHFKGWVGEWLTLIIFASALALMITIFTYPHEFARGIKSVYRN